MTPLNRRTFLAASAGATALAVGGNPALGAEGGITIAETFDPPGLDPTVNSVDLVSTITENVFETLYAFDAQWQPAPLLASGSTGVSPDGKTVTIPLRTGVPFHDGGTMGPADVAASIRRWVKLSSRGQLVAPLLQGIDATGTDRVVLHLSRPFPALLTLLAFNSATAIILPRTKAEGAMDGPLTRIADLVGTGPFRIAARRPAQYTRLARFDQYKPAPFPSSAYAGARKAGSPELDFVPVPNVNTRLQGLLSGEYRRRGRAFHGQLRPDQAGEQTQPNHHQARWLAAPRDEQPPGPDNEPAHPPGRPGRARQRRDHDRGPRLQALLRPRL